MTASADDSVRAAVVLALATFLVCWPLLGSASVAASDPAAPSAATTGGFATVGGDAPAQAQRLVVTLEPGQVERNGEATLNVSVANTSPEALRGVTARVEADSARVATHERVVSSLEPGEGETFEYDLEEVSPGTEGFDVYLHYTDTEGSRHGEYRARTVNFPATSGDHPDVAIGADEISPGGETQLNLTVANGLDESIRSMTVGVAPTAFSVSEPRRISSGLASGQSTSFSFQASDASSGRVQVPVSVTYTTSSGVQRSFERDLGLTLEIDGNPARVSLTELRVTPQAGQLTISGSASNIGGSDATGVTVSVLDGNGVGPAASESTFFVGEVPASDFSSFEVAARLESTGSVEIPLRVSYAADGTRTNRTVTVSYTPPTPTETQAQQSGGGGGLPVVAIAALVVLLVGVVVWRQYR